MWNALGDFANSLDNPCIVWGVFNIVQSMFEISSRHNQTQDTIWVFNLALLDCGLEDFGFMGSPYTWNYRYIWRCLDSVVCNLLWSGLFSIFTIFHLNRTRLDHLPLFITLDRNSAKGLSKFKFLHS